MWYARECLAASDAYSERLCGLGVRPDNLQRLTRTSAAPTCSGYKTYLMWGAVALPNILWLLERQGAAPSDLFVICEDSCLLTAACAPGSLSTKVKFGKNLWCGAVRNHKARPIDSVVDASNGSLALSSCSINVMALVGSKMIVCGIEFLRTWVQMYKISPTAWTVG